MNNKQKAINEIKGVLHDLHQREDSARTKAREHTIIANEICDTRIAYQIKLQKAIDALEGES